MLYLLYPGAFWRNCLVSGTLCGKSLRWRHAQFTTLGGIFWYTQETVRGSERIQFFIISPFLLCGGFGLKHQTVKANGAYVVSTKCDAKSSGNKKRIKDNGIQDSFPAAGFFCFVAAAPIFLISRVIFGKLEQLGRRAIKKSRRLKILFRRLNPAYNNANTIRSPSFFLHINRE